MSSLSFSSDLVRAMHARGSGEARAASAISHARGHLRVLRFARQTTGAEKRETARSLRLSVFERFPSYREHSYSQMTG